MDDDETPERIGRLLGRLVVRGRTAARQAIEPETQERMRDAYRTLSERAQPTVDAARRTWDERGPDIAEAAAHRAVDGALGAIGLRFPFLRGPLGPLADRVRQGAGSRARELAGPRETPSEQAEPAVPEVTEEPEQPAS
ncbi:MAG TPA: hypothetical protein VIA06_12100 [Candidatus Dormibacteraeota bacterium]|jgi:hypothetical protein|nr:hypothetical protein [Candidatus Dormibacteraeota bacterium]